MSLKDALFVEIRKPQEEERPRTTTAYMMAIEPKDCSKVVQKLATELPLVEALSHLKRVRNPQKMKNAPKKQKMMLQVLIGQDPSVSLSFLSTEPCTTTPSLEPVTVPGRPPNSKTEWQEFNELWPTSFLPLKSQEHQEQLLALSGEEESRMREIMEEHVLPQKQVVIVDPTSFTIVSTSTAEYQLQTNVVDSNPLATPFLLALQGVSRIEREAVLTESNESFSNGQYLCTGYDLYAPYEPTIFEAMAGLHHRLRRVIYSSQEENKSTVWRYGLSQHYIHCLPGTNHRYRAFEYKVQKESSSASNESENGK